jgi:hypothetical protein
VKVGAEQFTLPIDKVSRLLQPQIFGIRFHVNSHLLENGERTFFMSLRRADGAWASLGEATFNVSNTTALAHDARRDLKLNNTPLVFGQVVDSTIFPYATGSSRAWFDKMPIEDVLISFEPARDADSARRHLIRWGFAILPETLPNDVIQSFNREVDEAITQGELIHQTGSSE